MDRMDQPTEASVEQASSLPSHDQDQDQDTRLEQDDEWTTREDNSSTLPNRDCWAERSEWVRERGSHAQDMNGKLQQQVFRPGQGFITRLTVASQVSQVFLALKAR